MKIRKQALAALMSLNFVACLPAHAVVSSSFGGVHDPVESGAEFLPTAGTFAGAFGFSLLAPSVVSFTGFTNLPFLAFGLYSASDSLISGTLFTPTTFEQSLTTTTLVAGSYYYKAVFPSGGSAGSVYMFESSAAAVPVNEPESVAMLLAGLGIVGAIARRRVGV